MTFAWWSLFFVVFPSNCLSNFEQTPKNIMFTARGSIIFTFQLCVYLSHCFESPDRPPKDRWIVCLLLMSLSHWTPNIWTSVQSTGLFVFLALGASRLIQFAQSNGSFCVYGFVTLVWTGNWQKNNELNQYFSLLNISEKFRVFFCTCAQTNYPHCQWDQFIF